jgi:hypothetical protein
MQNHGKIMTKQKTVQSLFVGKNPCFPVQNTPISWGIFLRLRYGYFLRGMSLCITAYNHARIYRRSETDESDRIRS